MSELLEVIISYEFLFAIIGFAIGLLAVKTGVELLADLQDVISLVSDAVAKESDAGRAISPEEHEEIKQEIYNLAKKTWQKYKDGVIPGIVEGLSKLKFW